MNPTEIIKNLQELKEAYGHTGFPFGYYAKLATELRAIKHLYVVSDKINKEDKKALETLEKGSKEYERRNFLLTQDGLQQHLRLSQIERMSQELQQLTNKFNKLRTENES